MMMNHQRNALEQVNQIHDIILVVHSHYIVYNIHYSTLLLLDKLSELFYLTLCDREFCLRLC